MAAQNPFTNERLMGAVSYFGILFFIPLFATTSKQPFVRFHVRQGMVLFAIEAGIGWIPFFGWLAMLGCVIASIAGAMAASQGREWEIPFVGKYAKMLDL